MADLNVSDIQHFSTGDGPGIRTTVFLKGCSLRCPWCHNPETISPVPQTLTFPHAKKTVHYGRRMTVEEVLREVMEDADFYRTSGGGVTISGGEPMLWAEAVAELEKALQDEGIFTLIDTAGNVPREHFERVLPHTDTIFYDWKTSDPVFCREVLGGDFERMQGNLTYLLSEERAGRITVHVRIPLIPGVNTNDKEIAAMIETLRGVGAVQVDLLPFHRLAVGKYDAMGLPYPFRDTEPPTKEEVEAIAKRYREHFEVGIEN